MLSIIDFFLIKFKYFLLIIFINDDFYFFIKKKKRLKIFLNMTINVK